MDDLSKISDKLDVVTSLQPAVHAQCEFEDLNHKRCTKIAAPGEKYCNRHKGVQELEQKFGSEIRRLEIKAPPRLHENIKRALVDPDLLSLRPHIAVQQAMALDLIKNLDTGTSTSRMMDIRQRYVELERALDSNDDQAKVARVTRARKALRDTIFEVTDRRQMEAEYREAARDITSLIRQEMARLEKAKAWIPVGYFNTMIQNLIGALQANVKDPEVLTLIARVLSEFTFTESSPTTNSTDFDL